MLKEFQYVFEWKIN